MIKQQPNPKFALIMIALLMTTIAITVSNQNSTGNVITGMVTLEEQESESTGNSVIALNVKWFFGWKKLYLKYDGGWKGSWNAYNWQETEDVYTMPDEQSEDALLFDLNTAVGLRSAVGSDPIETGNGLIRDYATNKKGEVTTTLTVFDSEKSAQKGKDGREFKAKFRKKVTLPEDFASTSIEDRTTVGYPSTSIDLSTTPPDTTTPTRTVAPASGAPADFGEITATAGERGIVATKSGEGAEFGETTAQQTHPKELDYLDPIEEAKRRKYTGTLDLYKDGKKEIIYFIDGEQTDKEMHLQHEAQNAPTPTDETAPLGAGGQLDTAIAEGKRVILSDEKITPERNYWGEAIIEVESTPTVDGTTHISPKAKKLFRLAAQQLESQGNIRDAAFAARNAENEEEKNRLADQLIFTQQNQGKYFEALETAQTFRRTDKEKELQAKVEKIIPVGATSNFNGKEYVWAKSKDKRDEGEFEWQTTKSDGTLMALSKMPGASQAWLAQQQERGIDERVTPLSDKKGRYTIDGNFYWITGDEEDRGLYKKKLFRNKKVNPNDPEYNEALTQVLEALNAEEQELKGATRQEAQLAKEHEEKSKPGFFARFFKKKEPEPKGKQIIDTAANTGTQDKVKAAKKRAEETEAANKNSQTIQSRKTTETLTPVPSPSINTERKKEIETTITKKEQEKTDLDKKLTRIVNRVKTLQKKEPLSVEMGKLAEKGVTVSTQIAQLSLDILNLEEEAKTVVLTPPTPPQSTQAISESATAPTVVPPTPNQNPLTTNYENRFSFTSLLNPFNGVTTPEATTVEYKGTTYPINSDGKTVTLNGQKIILDTSEVDYKLTDKTEPTKYGSLLGNQYILKGDNTKKTWEIYDAKPQWDNGVQKVKLYTKNEDGTETKSFFTTPTSDEASLPVGRTIRGKQTLIQINEGAPLPPATQTPAAPLHTATNPSTSTTTITHGILTAVATKQEQAKKDYETAQETYENNKWSLFGWRNEEEKTIAKNAKRMIETYEKENPGIGKKVTKETAIKIAAVKAAKTPTEAPSSPPPPAPTPQKRLVNIINLLPPSETRPSQLDTFSDERIKSLIGEIKNTKEKKSPLGDILKTTIIGEDGKIEIIPDVLGYDTIINHYDSDGNIKSSTFDGITAKYTYKNLEKGVKGDSGNAHTSTVIFNKGREDEYTFKRTNDLKNRNDETKTKIEYTQKGKTLKMNGEGEEKFKKNIKEGKQPMLISALINNGVRSLTKEDIDNLKSGKDVKGKKYNLNYPDGITSYTDSKDELTVYQSDGTRLDITGKGVTDGKGNLNAKGDSQDISIKGYYGKNKYDEDEDDLTYLARYETTSKKSEDETTALITTKWTKDEKGNYRATTIDSRLDGSIEEKYDGVYKYGGDYYNKNGNKIKEHEGSWKEADSDEQIKDKDTKENIKQAIDQLEKDNDIKGLGEGLTARKISDVLTTAADYTKGYSGIRTLYDEPDWLFYDETIMNVLGGTDGWAAEICKADVIDDIGTDDGFAFSSTTSGAYAYVQGEVITIINYTNTSDNKKYYYYKLTLVVSAGSKITGCDIDFTAKMDSEPMVYVEKDGEWTKEEQKWSLEKGDSEYYAGSSMIIRTAQKKYSKACINFDKISEESCLLGIEEGDSLCSTIVDGGEKEYTDFGCSNCNGLANIFSLGGISS
jgi:hypothetical protein